ncbi:UvrD-helicase domain-containing protein [Sphingomonas sp. UYP23]
MAEVDLLQVDRGAIVAPAGCGKTQSIVNAAGRNRSKPVLIITHTNAGVTALRARLTRARVPAANYRLATLDGWALRVVLAYPELSGLRPNLGAIHYPALRGAVLAAIRSGALDAVLHATYSRVIVDEYQDCSEAQHSMVLALADRLPCAVLGDPLQRIFTFAGPVPDWDAGVLVDFPMVGVLDNPWRWINAGQPELGRWMMDIRNDLIAGRGVDISSAPARVIWTHVADPARQDTHSDEALAAMADGTTLIIGDQFSIDSRVSIARRFDDVQVVERAELPEAILEAAALADGPASELLERGLAFAGKVMTGVTPGRAGMIRRAEENGQPMANAEDVAGARLVATPSHAELARMLEAFAANNGHRVFRPDVLSVVVDALRRTEASDDLRAQAIEVKEARRLKGRSMPRRGIGSTLLLKGLEADHGIILDATPLDAANLYVALSRGASSVHVVSQLRTIGRP